MAGRYEDISERLRQVVGFHLECLGEVHGLPFFSLTSSDYGRVPAEQAICLAAGIHGDEPAGVEALVRLLERPGKWEGLQAYILPCINPSGFVRGSRENADGLDLNRQFHVPDPPREVALVKQAVSVGRYDLFSYLHEDDEANGFYVYETAEDRHPIARTIVDAVRPAIQPDTRPEIDGHTNRGGILEHDDWRTRVGNWSMGLYLHRQGTRHLITVETPGCLPFERRVSAHLTALEAILNHARSLPGPRP